MDWFNLRSRLPSRRADGDNDAHKMDQVEARRIQRERRSNSGLNYKTQLRSYINIIYFVLRTSCINFVSPSKEVC